jgi:Asp-tRNA(Asn)/Glu-tRNA(Gln) amidotransferase C subunit
MTDKTELHKLIDDVNEIEKVAEEIKAARTENREPSAEVLDILDRWERDRPIVDELEKRLDD